MTTVRMAVSRARPNPRLGVAGVIGAVFALHVLGWTLGLPGPVPAAGPDAVAIGAFDPSVYLAGLPADEAGWAWLRPYGALVGHFEYIGYAVAALFVAVRGTAAVRRRDIPGGPEAASRRARVEPSIPV